MVVHSDGGFTRVCWLIGLLAVGLWFERIHGLLSKAFVLLRNCNLVHAVPCIFLLSNQFKMSNISEQPLADIGSVSSNGFRDGSPLDEATSYYCKCKDDKWVVFLLISLSFRQFRSISPWPESFRSVFRREQVAASFSRVFDDIS